MITTVVPDYDALCDAAAGRIAALVQEKPDAVLGLATGSTQTGVYARLVRRHQDGQLDFSGVTCFNLDEYYPMLPDSPHSYHFFMQEHLFRHVPCRRWFVPDGSPGTPGQIAQRCREYESLVAASGGIDLQLLGIGRTGHLGFNEPGSSPDSRTRLVTLNAITREDAAEGFGGLAHVPKQAVSLGLGTIWEARELVVLASGAAKAEIVREAFEGKQIAQVPASLLRFHPNVRIYLDRDAASRLQK